MRFLIDECLSPKLTELAREKGYGESSHIVWLGLAGTKDWELFPFIVEGDWTFVTRNSVDFRGTRCILATRDNMPVSISMPV